MPLPPGLFPGQINLSGEWPRKCNSGFTQRYCRSEVRRTSDTCPSWSAPMVGVGAIVVFRLRRLSSVWRRGPCGRSGGFVISGLWMAGGGAQRRTTGARLTLTSDAHGHHACLGSKKFVRPAPVARHSRLNHRRKVAARFMIKNVIKNVALRFAFPVTHFT
jgi:hypothetical protein